MSWRKQTDEQLFPEMLWNRPENRLHAGTMLLVGGNSHGFADVSHAQQAAIQAGIGQIKTAMPDSLKPVLKGAPATEFLPSTSTGSLSKDAMADLKGFSSWAQSVWLVGDFGKNSETNLLIEQILEQDWRLILSGDAVDYIVNTPQVALSRPQTLLVVSFAQLQKLLSKQGLAITSTMGLVRMIDALQQVAGSFAADIVMLDEQVLIVSGGELITSKAPQELPQAALAVWWTQFPSRRLEALATALVSPM